MTCQALLERDSLGLLSSGPGLLVNGLFAALSCAGREHCRCPLSSG